MRRRRNSRKIGYTLFFLAGLGVLIYAVYESAINLKLIFSGEKVTGVVDRFDSYTSTDSETRKTTTYYSPVIKFTDVNGVDRYFSPEGSYAYKSRKVGDKVKLLYNPNNPKQANIYSISRMFLRPLGLALIGLIFMVITDGPLNFLLRKFNLTI